MGKNNIILIGMMGAGKTTIAKILADMLPSHKFFDIDAEIEDVEDMTISEVFEMYGEDGFRETEEITIREACKKNNLIISTGGGAFENETNRKVLLSSGKVFYLYAPCEILYDRIKTEGNRPMLETRNPEQTFKDLLDKRDINYRKADYIIDTSSLTPELAAKEILRRLDETVNIS